MQLLRHRQRKASPRLHPEQRWCAHRTLDRYGLQKDRQEIRTRSAGARSCLVGQEPSEITFPQLLTVLEVYGYVAVDDGGFVRVLPDASFRQEPCPNITSKDSRPASECVTQIIALKYASAPMLVPILRPMLPQYAHMAAVPAGNSLLISDRFANLRRIEALVKSLDTPENKPAPKGEPER